MTDDICECVLNHADKHEGADECMAEGPGAYACSRPEDHGGPHAACSVGAHPVVTWGEA